MKTKHRGHDLCCKSVYSRFLRYTFT